MKESYFSNVIDWRPANSTKVRLRYGCFKWSFRKFSKYNFDRTSAYVLLVWKVFLFLVKTKHPSETFCFSIQKCIPSIWNEHFSIIYSKHLWFFRYFNPVIRNQMCYLAEPIHVLLVTFFHFWELFPPDRREPYKWKMLILFWGNISSSSYFLLRGL